MSGRNRMLEARILEARRCACRPVLGLGPTPIGYVITDCPVHRGMRRSPFGGNVAVKARP